MSSTTGADDIDDECLQTDTNALVAEEERDDQNRKSGYHEGEKDGVHMKN